MKMSESGDGETNAMILVATQTTAPVPPILRVIHTVNDPALRYIIVHPVAIIRHSTTCTTIVTLSVF